MCHDTEHEKVDKQHIRQKNSKFNTFEVTSDLLISKIAKQLLLS